MPAWPFFFFFKEVVPKPKLKLPLFFYSSYVFFSPDSMLLFFFLISCGTQNLPCFSSSFTNHYDHISKLENRHKSGQMTRVQCSNHSRAIRFL